LLLLGIIPVETRRQQAERLRNQADSETDSSFQADSESEDTESEDNVEEASNSDDSSQLNMAAVPPAVPAIANPFTLGPGRDNTPLDFTEAASAKLYYRATAALTTTFDGKKENILPFLTCVEDRARSFGWDNVLTVPANGRNHNIITDYGSLTLTDITIHVTTYSGHENRQAQNSEMLYLCLKQSLTMRFMAEVLIYKERYHVNQSPSGALLLKQIITMTYIDNLGTATHIQDQLIDMPTKLAQLGGDIIKLNQWVKEQIQKLACLGEAPPQLLPYLWRAYQAAPDDEFVDYIRILRHQHEDRRAVCTADSLMTMAENKYTLQLQSNDWGKQVSSDLVALVAQMKKNQTAGKPKGHPKPKSPPNTTTNQEYKREAWKTVPPKEGQKNTKKHGDRTFNWCPYHAENGMWTIHDPKKCRNAKHPNHPEYNSPTPTVIPDEDATQKASNFTRQAFSTILSNRFGDLEEEGDDESEA
jgi:hypothetical protein